MEYVKKVPTGAEKITYQVRILDYLIENPFFSPVEEPYEVVSDVSQFHFTDNFYLPVIWSDRPVWAIKMNKRRTQKRRKTTGF